jgi:ferric-dicitrate binding protein FerR (iron transport regulator)
MSEDQNNILARWLNNEISQEERDALEKNGDAETLRRILATMETWTLPELKEDTYAEIVAKRGVKTEAKVVPLFQRRSVLAIAASILLLVGLFYLIMPLINNPALTELACNAGETKQFTLSDNTTIILYGKSKILYNKEKFNENRTLKLEGEAYLEVNKKGAFEVEFENGRVNVLGTKFNVLTTKDEAAVKCYEGKVKVEIEKNSTILTAGHGVRSIQNKFTEFDFAAERLPEIETYRQLENMPLRDVVNTLSVFYDVKIINENVDLNRTFTGQLNQQNLDSALTMIFSPMDIAYKKENNTVTIKNK